MKQIINISVNADLIDKGRIYKGKKGNYINFSLVLNSDKDKFDNHGFITQAKNKDENIKMPILGNAKIVWTDGVKAEVIQEDENLGLPF